MFTVVTVCRISHNLFVTTSDRRVLFVRNDRKIDLLSLLLFFDVVVHFYSIVTFSCFLFCCFVVLFGVNVFFIKPFMFWCFDASFLSSARSYVSLCRTLIAIFHIRSNRVVFPLFIRSLLKVVSSFMLSAHIWIFF